MCNVYYNVIYIYKSITVTGVFFCIEYLYLHTFPLHTFTDILNAGFLLATEYFYGVVWVLLLLSTGSDYFLHHWLFCCWGMKTSWACHPAHSGVEDTSMVPQYTVQWVRAVYLGSKEMNCRCYKRHAVVTGTYSLLRTLKSFCFIYNHFSERPKLYFENIFDCVALLCFTPSNRLKWVWVRATPKNK